MLSGSEGQHDIGPRVVLLSVIVNDGTKKVILEHGELRESLVEVKRRKGTGQAEVGQVEERDREGSCLVLGEEVGGVKAPTHNGGDHVVGLGTRPEVGDLPPPEGER